MDQITSGRFTKEKPLQLLAHMLRMLTYSDFMRLAADLHADSETVGKSPQDVADTLAKWAAREVGESSP
jgi:hypothetical protein